MTWGEAYFTFLDLTLQTFCLGSSTSRSNSSHCRLVVSLSYCTIDICATEFDFWCLTDKRFDWSKGDITHSVYFELTDFGNFFDIRASIKDWRAVFWETNLWTSCFKSNLTFLNLALQSFCLSTCGSWSDFLNSWCVLSRHWCTILIHSLNNNWIWCTNILLIWGKGNRTVWCHFKDTDIWNFLAFASIFESRRSIIIQWYIRVSTDKVWFTLLWTALWASAG
ncbi:hypothetical protein D8875_09125 [Streptococcus sanguinis]|nr:hypothetical protein D8875_09125 [Streptococcus sanguinis]